MYHTNRGFAPTLLHYYAPPSDQLKASLVPQTLTCSRAKEGLVYNVRFLGCAAENGQPNQIAGFLSCDLEAICNAEQFCACASQQNGSTWAGNHMTDRLNYAIYIHMLIQHNQEILTLVYQTLFRTGACEGLGARLLKACNSRGQRCSGKFPRHRQIQPGLLNTT